MTPDPHELFRRSRVPGARHDAEGGSLPPSTDPQRTEEHDTSVVLDAEFHQSVWKPWEKTEEASSDGTTGPARASAARGSHRLPRPWIISVAAGLAVVLIAAVLHPPLFRAPVCRFQPFVEDMSTQPDITWSMEGGNHCFDAPDEDQAILSDISSMWSLDLRDGSIRWKTELDGSWGYLTCAPAADVVAISEVDESGEVLRTKLLGSSTGEQLAELSGASTVQVVPLGPNVGLLDRNNVLTAVEPGRPEVPLWSHLLPGPVGDIGGILSVPVDATTTELSYPLASEALLEPRTTTASSSPPLTARRRTGHVDPPRISATSAAWAM